MVILVLGKRPQGAGDIFVDLRMAFQELDKRLNAACLSDGRGSIFDPASWWADREVDLAMTRLFGGFGEAFLSGYREVLPDAPGSDCRVEVYNLYHLINHANLFGGSYVSKCRASLRDLARQL